MRRRVRYWPARVFGPALALSLVLTGCGNGAEPTSTAQPTASIAPPDSTSPPTAAPPSDAPAGPPPGTFPPPWLGKRVLPRTADGYGEIRPTPKVLRKRRFTVPDTLAMLPGSGFKSVVTDPAPDSVIARSSWSKQCPVAAKDLSWVRLTVKGFDGSRHTGELLVNGSVDQQVVQVFRALWDADFPIEKMAITTDAEGTAPPTGDGNGTGSFNCRPTVGATVFSQHAYGLAVDVNPFQNPYVKGDLVLPELASSYLDRNNVRPGMITPDGPVVRAFAAIGWTWGGTWNSLKDYQHFSQNGR